MRLKIVILFLTLFLVLCTSVLALTVINTTDRLYYNDREVVELEQSTYYKGLQLYETKEPINKEYYVRVFFNYKVSRERYNYIKEEVCKVDNLDYCRKTLR